MKAYSSAVGEASLGYVVCVIIKVDMPNVFESGVVVLPGILTHFPIWPYAELCWGSGWTIITCPNPLLPQ